MIAETVFFLPMYVEMNEYWFEGEGYGLTSDSASVMSTQGYWWEGEWEDAGDGWYKFVLFEGYTIWIRLTPRSHPDEWDYTATTKIEWKYDFSYEGIRLLWELSLTKLGSSFSMWSKMTQTDANGETWWWEFKGTSYLNSYAASYDYSSSDNIGVSGHFDFNADGSGTGSASYQGREFARYVFHSEMNENWEIGYYTLSSENWSIEHPLGGVEWWYDDDDGPDPDYGSISGHVYAKGTGSDIEGATVQIEGTSYQAQTSSTGFYRISNVEPGTYSLKASRSGYYNTRVTGVEVTAGQETGYINFYLERESEGTGYLQVNSTPTGAAIYIDGSNTGRTTDAFIGDIPVGYHTLKLAKTGYEDWEETVMVNDGQVTTINANLTPIGGSDYAIYYYASTDEFIKVCDVSTERWYHVRLDVDCYSNSYDIYVDGSLKVADVPFYGQVSGIGNIRIMTFIDSRCPLAYFDELEILNGSSKIVDDGFENYSTGYPPGGAWETEAYGDNYIEVSSNESYYGYKSCAFHDPSSNGCSKMFRDFSSLNSGSIEFAWRITSSCEGFGVRTYRSSNDDWDYLATYVLIGSADPWLVSSGVKSGSGWMRIAKFHHDDHNTGRAGGP